MPTRAITMCCSPSTEGNGQTVIRKPGPKRPENSAAEMAVGALDGNPNPLDVDMGGIDPHPASLDLPEEEFDEACSNPRCTRHALSGCIICGQPF